LEGGGGQVPGCPQGGPGLFFLGGGRGPVLGGGGEGRGHFLLGMGGGGGGKKPRREPGGENLVNLSRPKMTSTARPRDFIFWAGRGPRGAGGGGNGGGILFLAVGIGGLDGTLCESGGTGGLGATTKTKSLFSPRVLFFFLREEKARGPPWRGHAPHYIGGPLGLPNTKKNGGFFCENPGSPKKKPKKREV